MKIGSTLLTLLFVSQSYAGDLSVCHGKHAYYVPKAVIRVTYPDTKGLPLDQASSIKSARIDLVRKYLKKSYFSGYTWDASHEEEQAYVESVPRHGMDPKLDRLMSEYTFRFPLKTVKTLFHEPRQEGQQHYGYDFDSKAWEPSLALEGANWMWDNYAWRQTSVEEVARNNGEVVFQVKLDLDLFCQTGVVRSDLISR